jgi:hypothetical protein
MAQAFGYTLKACWFTTLALSDVMIADNLDSHKEMARLLRNNLDEVR